MTREQKIHKRKQRSLKRALKNKKRNHNRWKRNGRENDCPYAVDIHGEHGTCDCGGVNYSDCLGDI